MNDYLGTSHESIYHMVQLGEPRQSRGWATDLSGIGRDIGAQIAMLREQCALISTVWSDGVGSVRLTADLVAVIDYLQVLADGLSGQSASYSNLTVQAAADLAAAQPPSALPPPPSTPTPDLRATALQVSASVIDPDVKGLQQAQLAQVIAVNQAAWLKAGETATALDNEYRTALARLTPPPDPPPIVQDAATAGGPVDGPATSGSAAVTAVSAGEPVRHSATGAPAGGWSVDQYLAGGTSGGGTSGAGTVGQALGVGTSAGSFQPVGASGSTVGSTDTVPAGATGANGVDAWTGGGVISAAVLSGGASALGPSRPRVDPATLHGSMLDGSADAAGASLGAGGFAAGQVSNGSVDPTAETGFDPVTGSAISAGPGRFDSAAGADGSGWQTAAGVGGIAALAAGAVSLSRGGAGAITAAGLSGGYGSGAGGVGVGGSGAGGSAVGAVATGGAGAGAEGPGAAGRGIVPGMPAGSNSMVQGGQIGQTGRGVSGAAGPGIGRPGAAGSGIGGEHGYRVTWLVEDRDLYGKGPSVKSVIEEPTDVA